MVVKRIAIALLLLICATSAFGGSTARQVDFLAAGLEKDGDACTGCKVYTYETGTTTAKTTYLDRLKAANQTNPIILDSEGRAEVFADGLYTFVIKTASDGSYFDLDGLDYGTTGASFTALSQYAGLSEAIADIGATDTVLVIDDTDTLDASLTVPLNVTLMVTTPDAITLNGKTLTINGKIWAPSIEWIIGATGTVTGTIVTPFKDSAWVVSTVTDTMTVSSSTNLQSSAIINTSAIVNAGGGIKSGNIVFQTWIGNIGGWDMNVSGTGSATRTVATGLTGSKTRGCEAWIVRDDGINWYELNYTETLAESSSGCYIVNSSGVATLYSVATGFFDEANYDDSTIERGWVIVDYIP